MRPALKRTVQWKCPFFSLRCRTSGYKNLSTDSTTQECDQDSTNKGKNYEEELPKSKSWLKRIKLICSRETENLKNSSFVYVLYVIEQICTQDSQRLPDNWWPMTAGRLCKVPYSNMWYTLVFTADQLEIWHLVMKREFTKKHKVK